MDQNDTKAQNDTVLDTNLDAMPTSESEVVETQVDQPSEVTTEEESQTAGDATPTREGRKPTRLERNLQKQLEKSKAQKERIAQLEQKSGDVYDFLGVNSQTDEATNLFTEEELATGEFNPKELEKRVAQAIKQQASKEVEHVLANKDRAIKYRETVDTHTRELEELLTEMPELADDETADAFVEMYKDINYLGDRFIGKASPKEIAKRMFGTAKKIADQKTADVTKQMVDMQNDQAVVSGANVNRNGNAELEDLRDRATKSGRTEDWGKYFKARNSV